jgi:inorganic pyrophosphatase
MSNNIDVIVEIPFGCRVKYEWDEESKRMRVDRNMTTTMTYPGNYGFIDKTISGDNDPTDVLIVNNYPFIQNTIVTCRVIGALLTTDEKGEDEKIIAVPVCDSRYNENNYTDLPSENIESIKHFFTHYKDIDAKQGKDKWVKVKDYVDAEKALKLIEIARIKYNQYKDIDAKQGKD